MPWPAFIPDPDALEVLHRLTENRQHAADEFAAADAELWDHVTAAMDSRRLSRQIVAKVTGMCLQNVSYHVKKRQARTVQQAQR